MTFVAEQTPVAPGGRGLALGELNSTCMTLRARSEVAATADRDTAIICTGGSGVVIIGPGDDAVSHALTPGCSIIVAAHTPRRVVAGDEPLGFVTVHRRRGPLQLSQPMG
ncbi:MAG: hypothetical protein JWO69_266 [Thermoleophilia bacterium]|jgi:hypothetical protein|nr:hypothetical protein [Thermoleophilia bacterium]